MIDFNKFFENIRDNMAKLLPHNYSKSNYSNLGKLRKIIEDELKEVNDQKEKIKTSLDIDEAKDELLDIIGENLGQNRGKLDDDIYRLLIKSKIAQNFSPGYINIIIEYIAILLQINREDVQIDEPAWGSFRFSDKESESEYSEIEGFDYGKLREYNYEPAFFEFSVPSEAINDLGIPIANFVDIIDKLAGAGIRIAFYTKGTFEFSSQEGVSEYSEEKGFDYGKLGAYYSPEQKLDLPNS